MFQPDDNFNEERSESTSKNYSEQNQNLDNIDANLSPISIAVRKKQLEKIFTKLIIFGLTFGTILGIGAYYLLNKFGMTKKPYQLKQERIEREKKSSPFKEIRNSPLNTSDKRFKL